jgi:NAD(P)-dependent dehydrogenase (short-subunit alcohol dehydrogenase family)
MDRRSAAPVAVITGASRGLGAGLAERVSARGWQLGLCARQRPDRPASAAANGPTAPLCAALDVTDHAGLADFATSVVERFGRIDLWVNNAGLLDPIGPLSQSDPAEVARNIEVNVLGTAYGSAVFARHVRSRSGGGTLINISSGAASTPYAGWAPYGAAKAAVDQLTKVVALEEVAHGLVAYALSPGVVDTDMQALIRRTSEEAFPSVARFHQVAADDDFNSPAWVADQILELVERPPRVGAPDQVMVRIADQPRSGGDL